VGGSERGRLRRVVGCGAIAIVALVASNCGEFARTNPFDPAVPITLTLTGPDSAFAQYDTLHFAVTTDPNYDYDPPFWQFVGGLDKLDDNGTYRVRAMELFTQLPAKLPVTVKIGPRMATKMVTLVFRPTTLQVRLCADNSKQMTFTAFESSVWICYSAWDKRGALVTKDADVAPYSLTMRILDTTVVKQGQSVRYIRSAGNGTTRVAFSYGPATDTLQFTVRQELRSLSLYPPACDPYYLPGPIMMSIGDSIQVRAGAPGLDANRQPMADTTLAHDIAAQGLTWQLGAYQLPFFSTTIPVTVTPTGWVKAVALGAAGVYATPASAPTGLVAPGCGFYVY
jgi:hypothetical protein